jgi:hypothetical protein
MAIHTNHLGDSASRGTRFSGRTTHVAVPEIENASRWSLTLNLFVEVLAEPAMPILASPQKNDVPIATSYLP